MEDIKNKIDELTEFLNYHSFKYYVEDSPEISDFEFDKALRELEKLKVNTLNSRHLILLPQELEAMYPKALKR